MQCRRGPAHGGSGRHRPIYRPHQAPVLVPVASSCPCATFPWLCPFRWCLFGKVPEILGALSTSEWLFADDILLCLLAGFTENTKASLRKRRTLTTCSLRAGNGKPRRVQ